MVQNIAQSVGMQLSVLFFKVAVFFSIEGNPLHFTRLSWWNRFITSNIFLSMIYFLNEAFQEATLNFSIVHYWSPRITTSSQVCWIFKQLVAILVRLGALSFKHIFFQKLYQNEKSSLKVKLLHVLLCCELEGLLHIVLLRKVVTILKWNSQNCFWLSEMFQGCKVGTAKCSHGKNMRTGVSTGSVCIN